TTLAAKSCCRSRAVPRHLQSRPRHSLEKEIEQHGLATPNPAVEIEPLRRRAAPPREGKQIAEPRLAVLRQTIGEQLQLFSRQLLRGVRASSAACTICR